jgi:hypothetical protein
METSLGCKTPNMFRNLPAHKSLDFFLAGSSYAHVAVLRCLVATGYHDWDSQVDATLLESILEKLIKKGSRVSQQDCQYASCAHVSCAW